MTEVCECGHSALIGGHVLTCRKARGHDGHHNLEGHPALDTPEVARAETCLECGRVLVATMDEFWKSPSYSCPREVSRAECNDSSWLELYCAQATNERLRSDLAATKAKLALAVACLEAAQEMRSWYNKQMGPDGPEDEFDAALAKLEGSIVMITKRERLEAMAREWRQYADSHSGERAETFAHCSRVLLDALRGEPVPHTTLMADQPAATETKFANVEIGEMWVGSGDGLARNADTGEVCPVSEIENRFLDCYGAADPWEKIGNIWYGPVGSCAKMADGRHAIREGYECVCGCKWDEVKAETPARGTPECHHCDGPPHTFACPHNPAQFQRGTPAREPCLCCSDTLEAPSGKPCPLCLPGQAS